MRHARVLGAKFVAPAATPSNATADLVGWKFITLYALAYIGTILLFLAPLLVSLSLKVNALVGTEQAPNSLSLVAGTGAFLAMFANPFFGKLSDRTTSPAWACDDPGWWSGLLGGSLGILVVALAPNIRSSWSAGASLRCSSTRCSRRSSPCCPTRSRSPSAAASLACLGICLPIASVSGTYVVQLFTGNTLAMFLAPCAIGGSFIVLFAAALNDRRLDAADRPAWSRAGVRALVLRQPAQSTRLRVGLRQPLHVRPGLRLPDHLPGLLPAGEARQRRGRRPATAVPRHVGHVERGRGRLTARWLALGP